MKKILQVDLNLYMVKKMLMSTSERYSGDVNDIFYAQMCQNDLRRKFESTIDYAWSVGKDLT
jgi:hypothetical protein